MNELFKAKQQEGKGLRVEVMVCRCSGYQYGFNLEEAQRDGGRAAGQYGRRSGRAPGRSR